MYRAKSWLSWLSLALAVLCASPGPSSAQPSMNGPDLEQARVHFRRGVDYYSEGDYASALLEFERAYELHPTYRLLFNLGQVAYEQRDYVAAERYFSGYLEDGGDAIDPERRATVENDLERLRERVGHVSIRVNKAGVEIFLDGESVGTSPIDGALPVSAGRREVRAELDGHTPVDRVIEVVGGESTTVSLELKAPIVQTEPQPAPASAAAAPPPPPVQAPPPKPLLEKPAFYAGVFTVLLAAGGGVSAYLAQSDADARASALERGTSRAELDNYATDAKRKALAADIMFGGAIVAGTLTLILALTNGGDEDEREISVAPLSGASGGALRLSF